MKKLDVRFDTEKVNCRLKHLASGEEFSKSDVARAAMNIGLNALDCYAVEDEEAIMLNGSDAYCERVLESIEENK